MDPLRTCFRPKIADGYSVAAGWLCRTDKATLWDRLSLFLVLLGTALVILTFRDYGVTVDEPVQYWNGNLALDYYLSFFADRNALHRLDPYYFGAAFDMAATAVNRVCSVGTHEIRHILNGLVGILGVVGCCKLGRAIGGPRAGFLAALLLLLTPNYYGQMFNNPKESPSRPA